MNELELLEEELAKNGIELDWYRIQENHGYLFVEKGEVPYIAIDPALTNRQKLAVALHEVGHLKRGLSSQNRRDELRADRWAFKMLIKTEALIEAIKKQPRSIYELAELMDVDSIMLHRYLISMSERRVYQEHGDYVISFCPIMLYNWRTGQIWPG